MPDQNQETLPTNKILNEEKLTTPIRPHEQERVTIPRFISNRIQDIRRFLTHNPSNPERALEKIAVLDLPQEKENLDRLIDYGSMTQGLLSHNEEQFTRNLRAVGENLSVNEAATALARMTRENHSDVATSNIGDAIGVLNNNLNRRRGEAGAPLNLTAEETAAVADFFSAIRETLPRIRENGRESYVTNGLHNLFRGNQELSVMAADLIGDLLMSEDFYTLRDNLSLVNELPVREAATALARMTRENHSDVATSNIGDAIGVLNNNLNRRRGEAGAPLNLTAEETAAVADFFSGLREMLPRIQPGDRDLYVTSLHNLLRRNQELSVMAADLIGNLLIQADNSDRFRESLYLTGHLPLREVATVLARVTRENHSNAATLYIDDVISTLRRSLIQQHNRQSNSFTAEETAAVADFFSGLREMLPFIQRNNHEKWVTSAFEELHREVLNRNQELSVMAAGFIGDLLITRDYDLLRRHIGFTDRLPLREAATVLARMTRENVSHNAALCVDEAITTLDANLNRQRGEDGAPLSLTAEETAAVADFFSGLREMLPRIRENNYWAGIAFPVNTLLGNHPELASLASDLVTEIWITPAEDLTKELLKLAPELPRSEIAQLISGGGEETVELLQTLRQLNFLNESLLDISSAERRDRLKRLSQLSKGKHGQVRMRIITHIFQQENSQNQSFLSMLNEEQPDFDIRELPEVFNDQAIYDLISVLADNPQVNKFQLALLLSQTSLTHMPQDLRGKLKPIIADVDFKIKPEHGGWWLCNMAEPRLATSMENTAVVLVNGSLLVKFDGKFSALCLQNTTTKEGFTFLEGTWYSPVDRKTRDIIKRSFDEGEAKLTLEQAEWALMRNLEDDSENNIASEDILQRAREFAQNLGDKLPDTMRGISREQYRESRRENG